MKIARLAGREIIDSRGIPTVECDLFLADGTFVTASVPSGSSRSQYEAAELRDGGPRCMGLGVAKAIESIENKIAPLCIGKDPDVVSIDLEMIALDGTKNKTKLGANAMLAVSMAVIKAQASIEGLELYELIAYLSGMESVSLPLPMFNMINGGMHAHNALRIQEFLVIPVDASHFRQAMEAAVVLYNELKSLLLQHHRWVSVGEEGGISSNFNDDVEAIEFLCFAIDSIQGKVPCSFVLALDVAASHFYDASKKRYTWGEDTFTSKELIAYYKKLVSSYPIISIEDGLSEYDAKNWQVLTKELSSNVQIVGDDIFATNTERIAVGIEEKIATAAVIKPNQVGTITETLQALKVCSEYDMKSVVSHRSGETNDTFIADLAVGASANFIKAGGVTRGERLAKYNHLMTIEDELALSMLKS